MASGVYPDIEIIERSLAVVTASTIFPPFLAPCDLDIVGMVLNLGTAPGAGNKVNVNISNSPTSQLSAAQGGTAVAAFSIWTAANVPSISAAATTYPGIPSTFTALIENFPYALNYPLPGPSGTAGYVTAQATSQTTEVPVTAPPNMYKYQMSALVAPDATYTDYNGQTAAASRVNAGDVLSFVITGTGLGTAANLAISLFTVKR